MVASKEQQKAIAEFGHSQVLRHATFQGGPGSGKTLMMGSTTRIAIRKIGGDILLIVLSSGDNYTSSEQLHNYLDRGELRLVKHHCSYSASCIVL